MKSEKGSEEKRESNEEKSGRGYIRICRCSNVRIYIVCVWYVYILML